MKFDVVILPIVSLFMVPVAWVFLVIRDWICGR